MPGVLLDFRNNVIYNWEFRSGYSGDDSIRLNYVANYLKPGPSTKDFARGFAFFLGGAHNKIFIRDNHIETFPEKDTDNWLMVTKGNSFKLIPGENPPVFQGDDISVCRADEPFPCPAVPTESAQAAYENVLKLAGATLPKRDAVDSRLIEEVRTGKGRLLDSEDEVGGWPEYVTAPAPADRDDDGMPDEWETLHKLNPSDGNDGVGDPDGDGYTTIEEFLNGTDPHSVD